MGDKFIPNDEQWEKMKNHIKSDRFKKEDFFVFETLACGDQIVPNRYTKIMPDLLNIMEEDAKKGVSLMINHNEGQLGVQALPVGRVFDARMDGSSQEGETQTLYTTQYIHRDDSKVDGYSKNDIINLIETGTISDTSVGFSTTAEQTKCSICGNSIYNFTKCSHIPGRKYIVNEETNEVKECIAELHAPIKLVKGNNCLIENSLCFDGAYSNAVIQSRMGETEENKEFKKLEGKVDLSANDLIIGYSSNGGVNLLYKKMQEKGGVEEMAKKEEVVEVENSVENSVETVDNVENIVENSVETIENTEETAENTVQNVENSTEVVEKYSEQEILEKFGKLSDSLEGLISLAKEGLEARNDAIEEALERGIHSMGNAFNKEVFSKTFSNMSIKDIKLMGETWQNQADMQFNKGRVSAVSKIEAEKSNTNIDYSQYKTSNY